MTGKKIRKRILRILLVTIASLSILVGIAVLILFTQQQRLTNMAIKELNKDFAGELLIEKSRISLFQNYPYISIALHNVRFFGNKQRKGRPMYEMERLYVGFSLPDIFKQKYNVRGLFLKNGHLDVTREKNGTFNLLEAKGIKTDTTTATDASAGELELNLRKMVLRNVDISYHDKASGEKLAVHIDKMKTAFSTDSTHIIAGIDGNLVLDITGPADTSLFRNKHIALDLKVDYDKLKKFLNIPPSEIKLEEATFRLQGTADLLHDALVDFKLTGDKPDFNLLTAFAPNDVAEELKRFRYDGRIYFDGTVKGKVTKDQLPHIQVSFGCEDAWFLNADANKKIDQLGFKGFFTNGSENSMKTAELHVLNMNARPDKGTFKGNFVIRDFTDPKVIMQLYSELELQFIGEFLGIKDLQRITGHISLKMDFKEMVDLQVPEESLTRLKDGIQSELTVTNLAFRIPNYPHTISNMDLHARMKNGRLTLDSLGFRVGASDIFMSGSLSDLPAIFHQQEKPVAITFNARSKRMVLSELLAFDTSLARKVKEEVNGFNIGLSLETSVQQLQHPAPLPKGQFHIEKLYAGFKLYPHRFHDFGATLTINDTSLLLRNFGGKIDDSDFRFSGRVINYQLWFEKMKKGKTQIAFDLKSSRLAMADLLGPVSRKFVPEDYQHEVGNNIWLRTRTDLRYDTVFKRASIRIANISGELKEHKIKLENIKGNIRYGANKFLRIDSLTGKIGRSDFDINVRLFAGKDRKMKQRSNYLSFSSSFLDVDQLTNYSFTSTAAQPNVTAGKAVAKGSVQRTDSVHAKAFNIFTIPFTDFNVAVNVGKIKYHQLWLKDLTTNIRMQKDQHLFVDTLGMGIAEGRIGMKGHFNGTDPQKIYFRSRIRVDDLNIEKLMIKLDHFGQDYVINKNIHGRLNGVISSHLHVHPDLTPVLDDSEAQLDVEITNGSLLDFAPMQAMSTYFKDKNLRMVRFDTLRNKLSFKKGVLLIPTMNINSSLGFIEVSGKQSMDLSMEYYLRIPLKMVTQVGFQSLFGKKREEVDEDQVDAIEYRDKDKKIRFMNIKISGTPDKYNIGLGKKGKGV